MTIVYLVRHSKPLKVNNNHTKDSLQIQNEKKILSSEGEALAEKHFSDEIFNNIDCVYSSNYIRAISTAKDTSVGGTSISWNVPDILSFPPIDGSPKPICAA